MLFKPHIQLERITDITPEILHKLQVEALFLDVDNTMSTHKGKTLLPGLMEWIADMQSAGIRLVILSNAKPVRLSAFAKRVGLPFVGLGAKPLPFGYFRAATRVQTPLRRCAIVGDQLFTDMLGGHLSCCKTLLLCPIALETSRGFRFKRGLERLLLRHYGLKCDY